MSTEAEQIAVLAAAVAAIRTVDKSPIAIIPEGYGVEGLEKFLDQPLRKRGHTSLKDAASFIAYVNLHQLPKVTQLYGNVNPPRFRAVFDDNNQTTPAWREFTASYECPLSVEWKTWTAMSGKQLSQEQFAQFIEDNLPDIASPPAAEMLEISRTLEAKKKVNFASGIRLSNGQNELVYEEQISGTAAKGKFVVPEEFTIGIPVLEGGERYAVTARLRYRIAEGGKLSMWYELVRPHKIIEDAASAVWKQIEEKTGLYIFNGGI